MSHLEIRSGLFPQALPHHLTVGDEVQFTIRARIAKIEEDQVDVSSPGLFQSLPGERTTTLTVLAVESLLSPSSRADA